MLQIPASGRRQQPNHIGPSTGHNGLLSGAHVGHGIALGQVWDAFGFHNWWTAPGMEWVEARDAVTSPAVHRTCQWCRGCETPGALLRAEHVAP